jgi:hypothetical protein
LSPSLTLFNPIPTGPTIGIALQGLVQPGDTQLTAFGQILRRETLQGVGVRINIRETQSIIILQRSAATCDGPLKARNGVFVVPPDVMNGA